MAFNAEYADQIHRHVVIWLDKHISIVWNHGTICEQERADVVVFLICLNMMEHKALASEYIDKVLMHDSDEELLIQLTNETACQLVKDAGTCEEQGQIERAVGLYGWTDWLYNDANTLRRAACERYRQIMRQYQDRLHARHRATIPNQFHSEDATHQVNIFNRDALLAVADRASVDLERSQKKKFFNTHSTSRSWRCYLQIKSH